MSRAGVRVLLVIFPFLRLFPAGDASGNAERGDDSCAIASSDRLGVRPTVITSLSGRVLVRRVRVAMSARGVRIQPGVDLCDGGQVE